GQPVVLDGLGDLVVTADDRRAATASTDEPEAGPDPGVRPQCIAIDSPGVERLNPLLADRGALSQSSLSTRDLLRSEAGQDLVGLGDRLVVRVAADDLDAHTEAHGPPVE